MMIFARRNQRLFLKNTLLNSFCNKREDTFKYEKAGTERLLKQHKKRKGDKGIEYKTYEKWLQQWMSHLKDNLPYIVGIPVMGYVGMNLYLVSSLIDLEFYDPSYRALMNKLRYSIVGFNVFNIGVVGALECVFFKGRPGKITAPYPSNYGISLPLISMVSFAGYAFLGPLNFYSYAVGIPAQALLLYFEGKSTADGVLPYWWWATRFKIHLFLLSMHLILLTLAYLYKRERKKFPRQFKEAEKKRLALKANLSSNL